MPVIHGAVDAGARLDSSISENGARLISPVVITHSTYDGISSSFEMCDLDML